jgi:simple sugar transport system substrate-binding protein
MANGRSRRGRLAVVLAVVFLGAACSTTSSSAPASAGASGGTDLTGGKSLTIYFVGVAAPTGFHGYIARAAEAAGANLGVKVVYIFPDQAEVAKQVQKVQEALTAKPDGIVINAFGPDEAYADLVKQANDAGIPVGSAAAPPPKSGPTKTPGDQFLFRVGSDEYAAGVLSGQKLIELGAKGRVLVADQQPADTTCTARAQGEVDTLMAAGITAEITQLTMDPGQQAETVTQFLRTNPDTTAATSVCDVVDGFLTAKTQANRADLLLSGYDIVSQSLKAIQDGSQAFTIDQQQYWRGYMPVLLITHYLRYGLVEANYFLTGPTVVDKSNVDRVSKLVEAGYR